MGASLLSVSALNVLRSQSLPDTDFHDPAQVLERLNATFKMEQHDNRYFTIWYGVFSHEDAPTGLRGRRPSAGAVAGRFSAGDGVDASRIAGAADRLGGGLALRDQRRRSRSAAPGCIIFSDGVFEIEKTDGENWDFDEFLSLHGGRSAGGATYGPSARSCPATAWLGHAGRRLLDAGMRSVSDGGIDWAKSFAGMPGSLTRPCGTRFSGVLAEDAQSSQASQGQWLTLRTDPAT